MNRIIINRYLIAICLLAGIGFFLFFRLGALPLFDPDEPRYAQSAREMHERGSLMIPYFNHEPRLNKPVLYYWIIYGSYKLFGVSEFSARFGSAVAALTLLAATFFFAHRFCGLQTAVVSCLMLGSMPLFFVPARLTMPDMVFSVCMVLSLYCFYLGWETPQPEKKKRWFCSFYFLQVVAAWTKGPLGILIPVAVAVLSLLRTRDRDNLHLLRLGRGIPAVLVASLPWYLYILFFVDSETMLGLSGKETVGRIFGVDRSYEALYYYVPALVGGLFPWVFLVPWAWYKRSRSLPPSRLRTFCETWFLFVFVFFSLCAAKKFQYIALLSSVCALWLGTVVTDALRLNPRGRDTGFILSFFAAFCTILVAGIKGIAWVSQREPALILGSLIAFCTLLIPCGISLWLSARNHKKTAAIMLSGVTLLTLLPFLIYGAAWFGTKRSFREFVRENQPLIQQADAIYCSAKIYNSLIFYTPKPVYLNVDEDIMIQKLGSAERCLCVLNEKKAKRLPPELSRFINNIKYGKVILSNIHTPQGQARP